MFKNSPKLAPNTKLTWKTHFLPIEPIKRDENTNEPIKLLNNGKEPNKSS